MIDLDELERKLAYCERAHREADGLDTQAAQKVWAIAEVNLLDALRNAAPELIAMARRYQWLRGDKLPEHSVRWMQWEVSCWKAPEWTVDLRHNRLDAAIDAAMQEQKP